MARSCPAFRVLTGTPNWMRLHEVHRIEPAKSMAGVSRRGELICAEVGRPMRCTISWRGRLADAAVLAQKFFAVLGDRYPHANSSDGFARDVTAIDRILPDRQSRAGRSPGHNHLGIKPWLPCDPFDEIEQQRVRRVRHRAS